MGGTSTDSGSGVATRTGTDTGTETEARTGTEAGAGSVEGTSVEGEDVEKRGCRKDNLVVVEEKVVLVMVEVLVKMGEGGD